MIKRAYCVVALALSIAAVGAQERIAVLDTVLPKGIDAKVVIPITEKIMEEFVRSKLFTVLDRSYITKTLSELEFSTSDLTSGDSEKLATIGGFLKASYIVVSTVQQLESTYFLSAKMIEVKTGVITAQTSVNRDGSVSVLIDMAGDLGRQLVAASMGQDVGSTSRSGGRTAVQPTQSSAPQASAAASDGRQEAPAQRRKPARFSSVTADVGSAATIAVFLGNNNDIDLYTHAEEDSEAVSGFSYGISGIFPSGLFYLSAAASLTDTEHEDYSWYSYTQSVEASAGAGLDFMVGPVMLYAGARLGYLMLTWTEEYYDYSTNEGTWSGLAYGFETGADARLGRLVLGLRYSFVMGTLSEIYEDWVDLDAATGSLSLRAGFAF